MTYGELVVAHEAAYAAAMRRRRQEAPAEVARPETAVQSAKAVAA